MPDLTESSDGAASGSAPAAIADRVEQRLILAGLAFDRRHGATRPKRRARRLKPTLLNPDVPLDPEHARERACLRIVFRDLGDAHRRYRTRTGVPGTPALRAAAYAFKAEPSVVSLVPVAAFLDELGILAW
jgi:hypothetical protein